MRTRAELDDLFEAIDISRGASKMLTDQQFYTLFGYMCCLDWVVKYDYMNCSELAETAMSIMINKCKELEKEFGSGPRLSEGPKGG